MNPKLLFTGLMLLFFAPNSFGQYYYEQELLAAKLEKKEMRQKASVANGGYMLFQAGLRRHENAIGRDLFTSGYGDYNGIIGVNYGYRLNNASVETGLGFLWHYHRGEHFIPPATDFMQTYMKYNSIFLPLVLKYDVPTGESKKFRFGALGSINFLLLQTRNSITEGRERYYFDYRNQQEKFLIHSYFSESARVSGFFKAGVYAEFQIFKSSFLNIQFSRAIPLAPVKSTTYQWEYENASGSFLDEVRIDGYMVEVAYKLPFNLFSATK